MRNNLKAELKQLLPCIIAFAALFLLLPLLMYVDGMDGFGEKLLHTFFPITSYVVCMGYGVWKGYDWFAVLLAPALFAVSMLVYFDVSVAVYTLVYACFSLVGLVIGGAIGRSRRRR